jgi:hypothetical protein
MKLTFIIASCLFTLNVMAAPAAPPAIAVVPGEWITYDKSNGRTYQVLNNSVSVDAPMMAVEFLLRIIFDEPQQLGSQKVTYVVEHTLVLCRETLLITMNQLQYDAADKRVAAIFNSSVHSDSGESIISRTISTICKGAKSKQVPKEVDQRMI